MNPIVRPPVDSQQLYELIRLFLDSRLGGDPGTLNFCYPYARFMDPVDGEDVYDSLWGDHAENREFGTLYAHIPFCPAHCSFCGFATTYGQKYDRVEKYLASLRHEASLLNGSGRLSQFRINSLFVGGGTPNALQAPELLSLGRILRSIGSVETRSEFSIEVYPKETMVTSLIPAMLEIGVTRVSLCSQDHNDDVLQRANRQYSGAEALRCGLRIKEHGISEMNLDLMVGIPGQSRENAQANFDAIDLLAPSHVTLNPFSNRSPLIPLGNQRHRSALFGPEEILELYDFYRDALLERGYQQETRSNFCLPDSAGFEYEQSVRSSRRRIGIGVNALSFTGEISYRNYANLAEYTRRIESGQTPVESLYKLAGLDKIRSQLFYGVLDGHADLEDRVLANEHYAEVQVVIQALQDRGLLRVHGNRITLTEAGVWNTGIVQRAFLPPHVLHSVATNDGVKGI